jgi:hypothetical protein
VRTVPSPAPRLRRWLAAAVAAIGALALTGCHPTPLVSVADTTGREGGFATFPVRLIANGAGNSPVAHNDVELYCTTTDGTATSPADYVGMSDQRCGTIAKGSTTTDVKVVLLVDGLNEGHETFTLTLRVVGAGVADGVAAGAIF